jgi:hypothetical protein
MRVINTGVSCVYYYGRYPSGLGTRLESEHTSRESARGIDTSTFRHLAPDDDQMERRKWQHHKKHRSGERGQTG